MALRNIVQVGDPILRMKSAEVTEFDEKLHLLLDDMIDTVKEADGAGLAAPQVGVLKKVFIINLEGNIYEFINPKIVKEKGVQVGEEGCLSVKGKFGRVQRFLTVDIVAQNRYGEKFRFKANGFFARAIQHEYDHLFGTLYIDKASEMFEENTCE